MGKEFTGVLQGVSVHKRFLLGFQYRCEKDSASNQLALVTVERNPATKESDVPTVSAIPDDIIDLDKGYYHGVYV